MAASTANPAMQKASEAARRYAGALFDLAKEKSALAEVSADMKAIIGLAGESEDLRRLLSSPAFTIEEKTSAVVAVAEKAGFSKLTIGFLGTMAQNGRSRDVIGAAGHFDVLYAKERGVKRAVATTAKEMNAAQRAKLEAVITKAVGSDVELTTEVNPDLVGGIQLRVGSTLIDASIAAKLERMNTAMKGA